MLLVRELQEMLRQVGCQVRRTQFRSSHEVWQTPGGRMIVLVVNHRNKPVSRTVFSSIRRALREEGIRI